MKLTDDERLALVDNRMKRAFDTWSETENIIESKLWYAAANRMYYACYYITTALLILHGYNASTHSGVIRLLGQHFVQTQIINSDLGRFYSQLFELRQSGDYDDWKVIEAKDILPLAETAKEYLQTLSELINKAKTA